MKDYYKVLGVDYTADYSTIKHAYLLKIKKYHPDRYMGDKNFAEQKTIELNQAYNTLKDETLKREYDIKIKIKQKENSENWFVNFFKKIWQGICGFFVSIHQFSKRKRQAKNLKKLQKKYKKERFSTEELSAINDKKKLTAIIVVSAIALVVIVLLLVL